MRALSLLSVCLLAACTTFFDTDTSSVDLLGGLESDVDGGADAGSGLDAADIDAGGGDDVGDALGDAEQTGACCINGSTCQDDVALSACSGLGGEFFEGQTCEQSGCLPTCRAYCAEFVDTCSQFDTDLARRPWCDEFCGTHSGWPAGTNADVSGSTIGCRITHTGRALAATTDQERAMHCGHAGMTGGDTCGSWCENYCQMALTICTDGDAIYADFEECNTACQTIPDDGTIGDTVGNSVQCRMWHLGAAAESGNTSTHCPHASVDSADNTCVE